MRNKRKIQELKTQIIELRNKEREVQAELKQKMVDLYQEYGASTDHAVKMV